MTARPESDPMKLRPMTREDIPLGMRLKEIAGWNQTPADWETFLSLRPDGCFVAEWDGVPAGTVTTVNYDDGFSWVGMVLVDPAYRRRGIGTRLLEEAIRSLEGCETVKLDATPDGEKVYVKLGFVGEYGLSRQVCRKEDLTLPSPPELEGPDETARPMQEADLTAVVAHDAHVFGKPRRKILEAWHRQAPGYSFVVEGSRGLLGYCLGRHGSRYEHVGPLVAESCETAQALLLPALRAVGARAVLLDAHLHEGRWIKFLAELGFREQRGFLRMFLGPNRFPGNPERQWAASGPELG